MSQKAKITNTLRTRVKKDGSENNEGYLQCNMCHGTGVVKKGYNRKKK